MPASHAPARPLAADGFRPGTGWLIGIVLAVITFWLFAQTFINVNPAVQSSLGIPQTTTNLAVSVAALFSGIFVVVAGGLADRLGRVRMLRIGLVLSIIGSALVALAPADAGALTSSVLLGGRIAQGLSAAAIMPSALALINTFFQGTDRQRAVSFFSIGTFGGSGVTSFFGGLMASSFFGWRGIFALSILVAIGALLLTRGTPEVKAQAPAGGHARFDLGGVIVFVITLLALNVYISQGPRIGWLSLAGIALLVVTVIGLIAFIAIETRKAAPFLHLDLFRIPTFTGAVVANFLANATIGTIFLVQNFLQKGAGWSPLAAASLTLGYLIAILSLIRVGEKLLQRFGPKRPMTWGMAILGTGVALCSLTFLPLPVYVVVAVIGMTLFGTGLGFFATPATDAAISSVPTEQSGAASGVFKMASSLGAAIGLAIAGAILAAGSAMDPDRIAAWGLFQGAPDALPIRFGATAGNLFEAGMVILALIAVIVLVPRTAGSAKAS